MRALAICVVAAFTIDAAAYVRSRTSGTPGTPVHWPGACVYVQPDSDGSPDLSPDAVFATVQKSLQNWQALTQGCSYLQLHYDTPARLEAHFDGVNVIKFRTDKWCHPDDAQSHNQCYSSMATAITTVFFVDKPGDPHNGTILDADVELNNLDFTFANVVQGQPLPTPRAGTRIADLENTLTHELGHLQGLDHTCKDAATPANEVDETGNPPPDCGLLSALPPAEQTKIGDATMFNQEMTGETKKRSPESDDVAGICASYPLSAAPAQCQHTNLADYATKGCDVGAQGGSTIFLPLLLVLGLLRRRSWPAGDNCG